MTKVLTFKCAAVALGFQINYLLFYELWLKGVPEMILGGRIHTCPHLRRGLKVSSSKTVQSTLQKTYENNVILNKN